MAINPLEQMSENFTLHEFLRSDIAERSPHLKRLQVNPPHEILTNLRYLVETTLQPIRDRLGVPVRVTSGYRSPELNAIIRGSFRSQHCRGEAADCRASNALLSESQFEEIKEEIISGNLRQSGKPLSGRANANFYLWSYCCQNLKEFDIDQAIHEYGDSFGRPAWVHISASCRQSRRQIVIVGEYTGGNYLRAHTLDEAIARMTLIKKAVS